MRNPRSYRRLAAVLLLLGGGSSAFGSGTIDSNPGSLGNAEVLLDPSKDNRVLVLNNTKYGSNLQPIDASQHVANPPGAVSGWNIKDLRFGYDAANDRMIVAVNTVGIAGDADGNGIQGVASAATSAAGGKEFANLGGQESITVFFDTNKDGVPDVVAGVPAKLPNPLDPTSKTSVAGAGLNGFLITKYDPSETRGEQYAYDYKNVLTQNMGQLFYNPSAENPDFIFSIEHFSKLPGLTSPYSFGVGAFAGSPDDVVAGEDYMYLQTAQVPQPEKVPEPATLLAWGVGIAGAAFWRVRRSRRQSVA